MTWTFESLLFRFNLQKKRYILKSLSQLFTYHSLQTCAHKKETFSQLSRQRTCLVWPSRLRDIILSCKDLHGLESSRLSFHGPDSFRRVSVIRQTSAAGSGGSLPVTCCCREELPGYERTAASGGSVYTFLRSLTHTHTHLGINCCTRACGNKQSHTACGKHGRAGSDTSALNGRDTSMWMQQLFSPRLARY